MEVTPPPRSQALAWERTGPPSSCLAKVRWARVLPGSTAAVVALVVLLLLPGVSHSLMLEQKALRGLKGMEIVVEDMQPEAENLGLTKAQIKTDVELRLRKAGVRVLTEKERIATPGMPYLYVNVTIRVRMDSPLFAYSIKVELNERVMLARGVEALGTIWSRGEIGSVGTDRIREIRGSVGDQVDKFINDYLAANPKK